MTKYYLPQSIEKPARYAGGELNSIHKTDYDVSFALCFPDTYEVGMSHIGLNLLYEILNSEKNIYAQRAFAPWPDMGEYLKKTGEPLFSLEEHTPLKNFDIVGFNLSYEMCYTNVLYMMDLAGIPFKAKDRDDNFPLIVGGGTCVVNPEPVADFFDVFVLGDAEEAVITLCRIFNEFRGNRKECLKALSKEQGFYVPSLYSVTYHPDGRIARIIPEDDAPPKVTRIMLRDFDGANCIHKPVLPFVNTVHDRCTLEIMRGCTRGCRFCQAGYIYRPVRERSRKKLMDEARQILANTGYDEISLSSLSSGDYSEIVPLTTELINELESRKISVSLPSMRVDSFSPEVAEKLQQVRKTGLTFAPEAGTQRLRDVINKNVTDEDIFSTIHNAMMAGANTIKLYFMIGLPTETKEDLEGIVSIVRKIKDMYYDIPKGIRKGALSINVSVSNFVPKPQTPFMWTGQNTIHELCQKQDYLAQRLKIKGVKFSYHDSDTSFLEAVFARGDRKLSSVLAEAYKHGCRFDSWKDIFNPDTWKKAFLKYEIDPSWYACRERETDEIMPFEHLDYMIDKDYYLAELKKSGAAQTTPDCREKCLGCGVHRYGCPMHGGEK